jgi:pimeloyl-ACP methyl ester carboxylesterase
VKGPARLLGVLAVVAGGLLAGCSSSTPTQGGTSTSATSSTTATGSTGGTSSTSSTTPGAVATSLRWSSCDGRFQCARLTVPLSYSDPSGATIQLEVVRLRATGADPIGDLVMNPGGPGGSGVQFLEQSYSGFPTAITSRFNLVSFDPRGIGQSAPVNCLTPAQLRAFIALNPAPTTPAQVNTVVEATKSFVADCERAAPLSLLRNLSTADTARDLDRLRAALGDAKLTYLGYSYGTYLGTVYAEMFPTHVRALVLDGAFDPSLGAVPLESEQAVGFEDDLHDFLAWCGTAHQCGAISQAADPYAAYEQLMNRFKGGMTVPADLNAAFGGSQQVNYAVALLGVLAGLYSPSSWPDLATALSQAETGNGDYLAAFAEEYAGAQQDGTYANILSAEEAISCLDRPSPSGVATIEQLAQQLAQVSPDFGPTEAWGSLACDYWPVPPQSAPARADAAGAPPILVVGSTRDPATPYRWAESLASQLPGAVLLTRTGDGHTAYNYSSCIRSWVDRYLITLALPPAGTVCASDGAGLP